MTPRIEELPAKKLVGKNRKMALANNQTRDLWQSFMPHRKAIRNAVTTDLFSLQVYDPTLDFRDFGPTTEFVKWAAVEVTDFDAIPDGMESFLLPGGLYAVFLYRGRPADFANMFHYIFGVWLPQSAYQLDQRPHFELLGANYKNDDPASEEEVWIPIRPRM
ncbi:GyrI-like domain-containing protein [Larkinella bovis]|uniref:GyrI-like domain-containing protein n=1 Tax=Larkinella bovis TaxID=683041 RepID=A0ABW0IHN1_9BACT